MTDETGNPVASAQVVVVGTQLGTLADNNGNFIIRNVPAGTHTIRATRIGFGPSTQSVTVPDDGEVTVNVRLQHAATRLEEVVTTATGEQSRREMGNVVATVKADSIASTAPIRSVNDLLQARTSGVQIIQGQGVIGAGSSIRIRGTGSLSLSNEPLVVVDGIRYDTGAEPGNLSGVRINRLATLNPEEIESVDIIKGPSAAALYGTAAANGVIIVKTKRGQTGAPRWSAYGELGRVSQPAKYPTNYWSWGRNIVAGVPQAVPAGQLPPQCKIYQAAQNLCVIDSLTQHNPWTAAETNPYADSPRSQVGLQVSGGGENLRYFVSVEREDETGPYKMPAFEIDRLTQERGTRPRAEQIRPNALEQTSGRGSFTFPVGRNANLDVSAGYVDRTLLTPFDGTFFAGLSNQMLSARGHRSAGTVRGLARETVGDIFSVENRTSLKRFTGSGAFNWSPRGWLQLTAEGGVDDANSYNYQLQLPGEGPRTALAWGPNASQGFSGKDVNRSEALQYTATLRGAGTYQITPTLRSQTTIGAQYFRSGTYRSFLSGYGLGVGTSTPNAASQRRASEFTTEDATYGGFISEQLAWTERLFWTISARTDQNSAFGRSAGTTVYPSSSASYVISEEPWFPQLPVLSRLRFRASVGRAGQQPGTTAALDFLDAFSYTLGGSDVTGLVIGQVGNPALRPEVTTEVEGGFDLGLLGDRVNVEFTLFNKISRGQLFERPLAPSWASGANQWVNVAKVQNRGEELAVDALVVQTQPVSWSVRLNGSHIRNKLVSIGDIPLSEPQGRRQVVGYPLNGLWDRPYSYADASGDGVIVPSEITLAAKDAYRGSTLPEYEAGFNNTVSFFENRVAITTLFDYRGSFWNSYTIGSNRCVSAGNCEAVNVPGSDLGDQAAAIAAGSANFRNTRWGIFQPNDFIRFRELSLAYNVPERLAARYLHGRSATLVVSGRNLGVVWTKYPGIDPEANRQVANAGGGNDDLGTPPALRYWTLRLNLGF